jgi:hypothetical protein
LDKIVIVMMKFRPVAPGKNKLIHFFNCFVYFFKLLVKILSITCNLR